MSETPKTTRTLVSKTVAASTNTSTPEVTGHLVTGEPVLRTGGDEESSSVPQTGTPEAEVEETPPVVEVGDSGKGFEIKVSNHSGCGDQSFEATVIWRGGGGCCDSSADQPAEPCPEEAPEAVEPSERPEENHAEPEPGPCAKPEPEPEPLRCIQVCVGLSSELPEMERMVLLTEAVAKINARLFARDVGNSLPCCVCCAGLEIDEGTLLRDARCLLEAGTASTASVVAYAMGRELAGGVSCRVVLVNGARLAYQREDGSVLDPGSKFDSHTGPEVGGEEQGHDGHECCCEQSGALSTGG